VDEQVDLGHADADLAERLLEHLRDRLGRSVRRRQRLADGDDAFLTDEAEVGEGAADVDADAVQDAVSITARLALHNCARYASLSSHEAYHDGVVKRTSLNLRVDLVSEARNVLGTRSATDTIHRALEEVVRRKRLGELADERFDDLTDSALEELRRTRTW